MKHSKRRHLTDQEALQEMVLKRDIRFLHGEKWKILLVGGLVGGPFLLLIVLFTSLSISASLWLLLPPLLLNLVWSLVIGLGHRSISWKEFKSLPPADQERRLNYESFWLRLYQGGFGLFASLLFLWGAARFFLLAFPHVVEGPLLCIGGYIGCLTFVWTRRMYLMRTIAEGPKTHPWLKPLLSLCYVSPGVWVLLSAIANVFVRRLDLEYALQIVGPFVLVSLWTLAVTTAVLGMLGLLIARLQYQAWRSSK